MSVDLDRLAFRLFQLAGRPDAFWSSLSEYEKEGWRHIIRQLLDELTQVTALVENGTSEAPDRRASSG